mgnify:FL=1
MFREIRYLNAIGPYPFPIAITEFYDRVEQFYSFVHNLNQLISWYNQIRQRSRPVEFNLFEDEITLIDMLLDGGIQYLDWNSPGNPLPGKNSFFNSMLIKTGIKL